jgi:hypothetical protein
MMSDIDELPIARVWLRAARVEHLYMLKHADTPTPGISQAQQHNEKCISKSDKNPYVTLNFPYVSVSPPCSPK